MRPTRRKVEDATVWIGYADFLTTLAVLFLVLVVSFAAKAKTGSAFVNGTVRHAQNQRPLAGCAVVLGERDTAFTDPDGMFKLAAPDIGKRLAVFYGVECEGYDQQNGSVSLASGETTNLDVTLELTTKTTIDVIPGDELFEEDSVQLRQAGTDSVRELGRRLKSTLSPGEVIAVQGHSDDQPFARGSGKDNWTLSGQRAAAAARVLTEPTLGVGIDECQVVIMGFGPSRPVLPITGMEGAAEKARKREKNRRIEFRRVSGKGLASGQCR